MVVQKMNLPHLKLFLNLKLSLDFRYDGKSLGGVTKGFYF